MRTGRAAPASCDGVPSAPASCDGVPSALASCSGAPSATASGVENDGRSTPPRSAYGAATRESRRSASAIGPASRSRYHRGVHRRNGRPKAASPDNTAPIVRASAGDTSVRFARIAATPSSRWVGNGAGSTSSARATLIVYSTPARNQSAKSAGERNETSGRSVTVAVRRHPTGVCRFDARRRGSLVGQCVVESPVGGVGVCLRPCLRADRLQPPVVAEKRQERGAVDSRAVRRRTLSGACR